MTRIESLTSLLREFAIISTNASTQLAAVLPAGLSEAQFGVLTHLSLTSNRAETPSDLARAFRISRPAMTQALARLVARGFVQMRPAPHDGRVRHVNLTDAGRAVHAQVLAALSTDMERLGSRFSDAELEALLAQSRRFRLESERILTTATETVSA